MLDGVPAGGKICAGGGLHISQHIGYFLLVDLARQVLVSSGLQHLRELLPDLPDGPGDGVTIHSGVHAAELVHPLRAINITALDVEAVEAEQRCLFAVYLAGDQNRNALVGVVLKIAVPELVLDDEADRTSLKLLPPFGLWFHLLYHGQSSFVNYWGLKTGAPNPS